MSYNDGLKLFQEAMKILNSLVDTENVDTIQLINAITFLLKSMLMFNGYPAISIGDPTLLASICLDRGLLKSRDYGELIEVLVELRRGLVSEKAVSIIMNLVDTILKMEPLVKIQTSLVSY